jgi:Fur family ferric uptake transcriptional regulator
MARATSYHTKQGRAVASYLAAHGDKHITVDEIAAALSGGGNPVGVTTIYRWLDKLERRGKVRKLVVDGIAGACFQYIGGADADSLHLMCEDCGQLIDLPCYEASGFESHILRAHRFHVDITKTVLYGKCARCVEGE